MEATRFVSTIEMFDIVAIVLLVFVLYMLLRNQWVYNRLDDLNKFWYTNAKAALRRGEFQEAEWWRGYYEEYASYDQIMWRFWIWDFEKFHYNPRPNPYGVKKLPWRR